MVQALQRPLQSDGPGAQHAGGRLSLSRLPTRRENVAVDAGSEPAVASVWLKQPMAQPRHDLQREVRPFMPARNVRLDLLLGKITHPVPHGNFPGIQHSFGGCQA